MVQFLSQDPYFVELFGWIENDVYTEDQRRIVIQEKKEHPTRSLHRRWKHEIQLALLCRRAAMARAVLPNPSARAEWPFAGIIDRSLTVGLATTTSTTLRLTQQLLTMTMHV